MCLSQHLRPDRQRPARLSNTMLLWLAGGADGNGKPENQHCRRQRRCRSLTQARPQVSHTERAKRRAPKTCANKTRASAEGGIPTEDGTGIRTCETSENGKVTKRHTRCGYSTFYANTPTRRCRTTSRPSRQYPLLRLTAPRPPTSRHSWESSRAGRRRPYPQGLPPCQARMEVGLLLGEGRTLRWLQARG